jgi:hypothetical protein
MYENEKQALESLLNFKSNLNKAQQHIRETYNVECEYDDVDNTLYIYTDNVNEALNVASAREYVDSEIGENFVTVKYGRRE